MILNGKSVDNELLTDIAWNMHEKTGLPVKPGELAWAAFQARQGSVGGQDYEKLRDFLQSAGIPTTPKRARKITRVAKPFQISRPESIANRKTNASIVCETIATLIGKNEQLAVETLGYVISKVNSRA